MGNEKPPLRWLLTGNPGVGKTTVIRAVVQRLEGLALAGFYTGETREGGRRTGFRIVTLDGQEGILATLGSRPPVVGRYSVHLEELERLADRCLDPARSPADLYVIDEIGKMELLSSRFRRRITELLEGPANILATIARKGDGFVDRIRRRRDVELVEVTRANRDRLPEELARRIEAALGPRGTPPGALPQR
ncbi:MAG TPA: NTPase [candidate division Zixibacteria bacterium]|nr:NTPase [candidate division Zixibacteria bacterium]